MQHNGPHDSPRGATDPAILRSASRHLCDFGEIHGRKVIAAPSNELEEKHKMPVLKTVFSMSIAVTVLVGAELKTGTAPLVTHEWGTFTSVAREDGTAVEWAPLLGPGDLPCFVTRDQQIRKVALRGLVRMETPVLYFYAQQPATLSIHVDFPHGLITEWYPNPLPAAPQRQTVRDS